MSDATNDTGQPDTEQPSGSSRAGVRSSDTTTRGIRVQVTSEYVPERSSPAEHEYLFQYHVRISNVGDERAKLVSRRWVITDADGQVERHEGPGVVGEQPMLAPGTAFEYTSFCPLKTSVGAMQGSYHMVTAGGDSFDAAISAFTRAGPRAVH